MSESKMRPNHRLKSVKVNKFSDERFGILTIANINNGKRLTRRDFIKAGGVLLTALGLSNSLAGCGGGGGGSETQAKSYYEKRFQYYSSGAGICLAFSPDGKKIVSGCDGGIKIWDFSSRNVLITSTSDGGGTESVDFSPTGERIVTGHYEHGEVKIWDASNGSLLLTLTGHGFYAQSVRFSPDGLKVVSGGWDKKVKVWDASNGNLLKTLDLDSDVSSVDWSRDGTKIAACGPDSGTIKVWDALNWDVLLDLKQSSYSCSAVAFSPDGRKIVSAGNATIQILDSNTGDVLRNINADASIRSISFSPDGSKFATAGYASSGECNIVPPINIWDISNGRLLISCDSHISQDNVNDVIWSPDGTTIVTTSIVIAVWSATNGSFLFQFKDYPVIELETADYCRKETPWMDTCTCFSVCTCHTVTVCTCDAQICSCVPVCTYNFV